EASQALKEERLVPAEDHERAALADLVASRKVFQRAVSEHPESFSPGHEENNPVAKNDEQVNQMAEFRDEAKSAGEYVQKLLEDQKALEQRAHSEGGSGQMDLALREREVERALRDF